MPGVRKGGGWRQEVRRAQGSRQQRGQQVMSQEGITVGSAGVVGKGVVVVGALLRGRGSAVRREEKYNAAPPGARHTQARPRKYNCNNVPSEDNGTCPCREFNLNGGRNALLCAVQTLN